MRYLSFILLVAFSLSTTGCMTIDVHQPTFPWQDKDKDKAKKKEKEKKKSEYDTPVRMVAIWTDTVYYSAGNQPTRGFGARLYFYNDKSNAIPVDGKLSIFAYDDTKNAGEVPENRTPDKRFVFTAEQFTEHFSKTDLGASYSIWIPWDAVGGEQAQISLLPVFTTTNGDVVTGQQSLNLLPGKKPAKDGDVVHEELPAPGATYEGQNISYNADAPFTRGSAIKSVTIPIPKHGSMRNSVPMLPPASGEPTSSWQSQSSGQIMTNDSRMNDRAPTESSTGSLPGQPLPTASGSLPQRGQLPSVPPSTRFSQTRSRALGAPIARLEHDRVLSRLGHGAQPFGPPVEPSPARLPAVAEPSPTGSGNAW